jgi:ribonucleotide monophosphatase NagD (HAD superfamily)
MTGKPNPEVINIIRKQNNIPESELSKFVMFGDNPTTDIALANNAGIDSVLVFTGVTKNEEEAQVWCG